MPLIGATGQRRDPAFVSAQGAAGRIAPVPKPQLTALVPAYHDHAVPAKSNGPDALLMTGQPVKQPGRGPVADFPEIDGPLHTARKQVAAVRRGGDRLDSAMMDVIEIHPLTAGRVPHMNRLIGVERRQLSAILAKGQTVQGRSMIRQDLARLAARYIPQNNKVVIAAAG